jgi:signal peptidase I
MRRSVGVAAIAIAVALIVAGLGEGARTNLGDPTLDQARAAIAHLQIVPRPGDHAFMIPSSSMEPTLHCARPGSECLARVKDRIITRAYGAAMATRGDIIAFRTPPLTVTRCGAGGTFIKRIIGLPGETFEERQGFVYIDGQRIDEPYVKADRRDSRSLAGFKVPMGRYFVLGDNRASSCDSRAWGSLPAGNIIGRMIAIYWPTARARRF